MPNRFLPEIFSNLKLTCDPIASSNQIVQIQHLPSYFDVSGLAAASFLAIGEALKSLLSSQSSALTPTLVIDQRLASHWFSSSLHLINRPQPTGWDPIAGDYQTANGWIRLHTNAGHHKAAALAILDVAEDAGHVAKAVRSWDGAELEASIVDAGGCAAQMRSIDDWREHAQGSALHQEPLLAWSFGPDKAKPRFSISNPYRPLEGLKVLDLTRVIAGPVATRALAGFGAKVLRIDPVNWNEPGLYEDITIGKRCAHLDLNTTTDRRKFEVLLAQTDVLIHGLRGDALARLGYSIEYMRAINSSLIDVAHNAYGWTGPWVNRRGFDSLVQMSAGIADFGMKAAHAEKPTPLPVQALDHATGNLVAAAAIMALKDAIDQSCAISVRTSLARVGAMLAQSAKPNIERALAPVAQNDFSPEIEQTHKGGARRLKPAIELLEAPQRWDVAAGPLRASLPNWGDST